MSDFSEAPSTLATDFLTFLKSSFDPESGGIGAHTDVSLQLQQSDGEPVKAHLLVLLARCPHLAKLLKTKNENIRCDCARADLLGVLTWIYLDELPPSATPTSLISLRALAVEWGLEPLAVAASGTLARALDTELCCALLRETAREEARARNADQPPPETCRPLRRACAVHATSVGFKALAACETFRELPPGQQTWIFAQCHDGYALHALAAMPEDALPPIVDREALVNSLLAPPHSNELDARAISAVSDGSVSFAAGSTPLHAALTAHNWTMAALLLDAGASPHPAGLPRGRALLHLCAEGGNVAACAFLFKRSAPINAEDHDGASPLDVAVLAEQADAATSIREHGGVSLLRPEGDSLIHHLASTGRPTPLAMLLTVTTVDAPNQHGLTPLHLAALNGHVHAAEALLDKRADVNAAAPLLPPPPSGGPGGGGSTLHIACRRGDAALVELLLERGASVTSKADTGLPPPLHLAVGDPHAARLLIAAGAAVEDKDSDGNTALHHAVSRAPPLLLSASCRALLEGGARANTTDFLHRRTPLHRLCERGGAGEAVDALMALIENGATLNAQDKGGFTPLHIAAFRGNADLALALVAAGASPTTPSTDGSCALSMRPPPPEALRDAKPVSATLRAAMLARIAQPLPWLPDAMSDHCQVCNSIFSGSNRRHHCRHCGRIVCAPCSKAQMPIPKFGVTKPTRVCGECAPVLELHGARALGPPGVGGFANRAAETAVAAHLDHAIARIDSGMAGVTGDVAARAPPAAHEIGAPPTPTKPPVAQPPVAKPSVALPTASSPSSPAANPFNGGSGSPPSGGAGRMKARALSNPFGDGPPETKPNPFGDDEPGAKSANPFGDADAGATAPAPATATPSVHNPFDIGDAPPTPPDNPFDTATAPPAKADDVPKHSRVDHSPNPFDECDNPAPAPAAAGTNPFG